jgi:hypothetical protein
MFILLPAIVITNSTAGNEFGSTSRNGRARKTQSPERLSGQPTQGGRSGAKNPADGRVFATGEKNGARQLAKLNFEGSNQSRRLVSQVAEIGAILISRRLSKVHQQLVKSWISLKE